MATPADQRLLELLEKWLASLQLHARYSSLDDDSYSKIQSWPEHQRPSRWIIDLAIQKAIDLQNQVKERIEIGDAKFSDSLELMTFLANLVGSEHIERFIPLAAAMSERDVARETPDGQPDAALRAAAMPDTAAPGNAATGTREMPQFIGSPRAAASSGTAQVARTERNAADVKPSLPADNPAPAGHNKPAPAAKSSYDRGGPSETVREQVIADATRLVQWGRKWYELAELIASMADRPHLTDVRRILKDNKAVIDKRAGRG